MPTHLVWQASIDLPPHPKGDFDHGDVYQPTGHVFIANTAAGTIEVIDGEALRHVATIPGCPEASGVLCAAEDGLVFAAARGAGKLLVIDAVSLIVQRTISVGSRPNGLAWDKHQRHLLVADVAETMARLVDPQAGTVIATTQLPGRPRWAVYESAQDAFLVNIRDPACVVVLQAGRLSALDQWKVAETGPHGLDLDERGHRAFVACDGGTVVTLEVATGRELARVSIAGTPDAIWHNHHISRLYVAIAHPGVVDVVNTTTMAVEEQITTEAGAHTTAYDSRLQRLYVFLPSCRVQVYEEREAR